MESSVLSQANEGGVELSGRLNVSKQFLGSVQNLNLAFYMLEEGVQHENTGFGKENSKRLGSELPQLIELGDIDIGEIKSDSEVSETENRVAEFEDHEAVGDKSGALQVHRRKSDGDGDGADPKLIQI